MQKGEYHITQNIRRSFVSNGGRQFLRIVHRACTVFDNVTVTTAARHQAEPAAVNTSPVTSVQYVKSVEK